MADKDPWNLEIAARLRAAMAESEIDTVERLADILSEPASRVRNWANGTSRPMAADARRIKATLGVTLDWLYEGDPAGLTGAKYIRLMAALSGEPAPLIREAEVSVPEPVKPSPQAPRRARASRQRAKASAT